MVKWMVHRKVRAMVNHISNILNNYANILKKEQWRIKNLINLLMHKLNQTTLLKELTILQKDNHQNLIHPNEKEAMILKMELMRLNLILIKESKLYHLEIIHR